MINSLILDPVSVFLTVIIIQNSITTVASWAQAIVVLCIGCCTVVLALFCPLPCASLVESATYPMSTFYDGAKGVVGDEYNFVEMATSTPVATSEEVIWEYEESGKFRPMDPVYSKLMEEAYVKDVGTVLKYVVTFGKNKDQKYHYEVNFTDFTPKKH